MTGGGTKTAPRVSLSYPFTVPGVAIWLAVAVLAAIPWATLAGWLLSLWVMVRVVASTARGERRFPPLPKPGEWREELELFGRTVAVVGTLLLPLWVVFGAAAARASYPDVPGLELVLAAGLFGTVFAVAFVPPALSRLSQGGGVFETLGMNVLFGEMKHRMKPVVAAALVLLYVGGFVVVIFSGLLGELGPPGAFVARAVSYGLQVAIAVATGLAVVPPGETEA